MDIKNPQNSVNNTTNKQKTKRVSLEKSIDQICYNQLNDSTSKIQYSFSKGDRFINQKTSSSTDKYYQLPQVLRTQRSSSFGFGKKIQFGKQGKYTPSPGKYQILRQFEGSLKKGSFMGLSRQHVKFNDMFKTKMNSNFPQPASYSIKIPEVSKKITIGQRFSQKKKWIDFVPGPGNYNHLSPTSNLTSTLSTFRTAPGTIFGKTERLKGIKQTRSKSPGPGNYLSNVTTIKKLGTTFGKAERAQSVNKTVQLCPGPGAYIMFSNFLH